MVAVCKRYAVKTVAGKLKCSFLMRPSNTRNIPFEVFLGDITWRSGLGDCVVAAWCCGFERREKSEEKEEERDEGKECLSDRRQSVRCSIQFKNI
jgi:hypothetical protein